MKRCGIRACPHAHARACMCVHVHVGAAVSGSVEGVWGHLLLGSVDNLLMQANGKAWCVGILCMEVLCVGRSVCGSIVCREGRHVFSDDRGTDNNAALTTMVKWMRSM